MTATTAIILDTRREKSDKTFPVKLRVTYQRKSKLYGIGINLTKEDWEKLSSTKLRDEDLKKNRSDIAGFLKKAEELINDLNSFSFENFEKKYNMPHRDKQDVFEAFDNYINVLNKDDSTGTAEIYEVARNSIRKFKPKLYFSEITPDFLKAYEKWMLHAGRSITTISIYLRSLRTVVNNAISDGLMNKEDYPFNKRKYQIPNWNNVKKALTIGEIEKIFNYQTIRGTSQDMAKDLWIFTYLCNGINTKDICRLKWKDLSNDKIVFMRAKTIKTNRSNIKPIIAFLTDETRIIIEKWSNKDKSESNFIFPFLTTGISSKEEDLKVYNLNKLINKYMKKIGRELDFKIPLTTYSARHSFSTVLKRSGASIEFISEALGHNSLKTTQNYLDSFEDSVKKEYSGMLKAFKNK